MIEVLAKGIGVGLAVAAPVGPIGLLCIKRTLTDGWLRGFASGLGAAGADATYGFMVAAGLAATGLLVSYAVPMTVIGGALIVLLGLMSIRSFLSAQSEQAKPAKAQDSGGLVSAFASTFVLTISNPMTILAFVALVSGLGASNSAAPSAPYVLVLGVFLGSALWWGFLVGVTSAARSKVSPRLTRWLDLISGSVLVIWGVWIALGAVQAA